MIFIYRGFKKSDLIILNSCRRFTNRILKPNGIWSSISVPLSFDKKVNFSEVHLKCSTCSAFRFVSFVHWFQPSNIAYRRIYHWLDSIHQLLSRLNWDCISEKIIWNMTFAFFNLHCALCTVITWRWSMITWVKV